METDQEDGLPGGASYWVDDVIDWCGSTFPAVVQLTVSKEL